MNALCGRQALPATQDKAAVFVDGRYTLQVEDQVDNSLFEYKRLEKSGVASYLKNNVTSGQIIGYDARLHSPAALKRLKTATQSAGGILRPVSLNPIDMAWHDRPAEPAHPVKIQPLNIAGKSHSEKRAQIAEILREKRAEAALITAPASIAWLLNIRGKDVMCTPLALSTLIIDDNGHVDLFIKPEKLTDDIRQHFGNEVSSYEEAALEGALEKLAGKSVLVDPNISAAYYFDRLGEIGANVIAAQDPIALPKACKNAAEISGTTAAHKRDGAALVHFLHWLDTEAQNGQYDEIDAAQMLESCRQKTGLLQDLSFESISGAGANGAIVHYRVSKATTRKLETGSLYLIDSGGQYVDGTTDVTRTIPIGEPSLAQIRFPSGTTGSNLDVLARMALWQKGLDYDHGTGHGVGVFLGVHEGPQRISKAPNNVSLRPGMIVSNEPGYYKTGGYGIRIENLQYVTEPTDIAGGERPMMGFETLTFAPIHKKLIDISLLSDHEIDYMNAYHARVWEEISPLIDDGNIKSWLARSCEKI